MFRCWGPVALLACLGSVAQADDDDATPVQVHGFVSQGGLLTSANNYLAHTERGSLEFTEAGINFTKPIDDRLSVGMQLFARDLGPEGNYSAKFDWLQIDYRWKDWLGFRAGRVKVPFGLYNDFADIDAAQPVVLLPQSIYPETNRNFLLAQTGLEAYGYHSFDDLGALDYRVYTGSLYLTIPDAQGIHFSDITVPWLIGGRVFYETPLEGLRGGLSVLAGEIDAEYGYPSMPAAGELAVTLAQTNYLGSLEYANNGIVIQAEYLRSYSTTTTVTPVSTKAEGMYGLAGYRWRPWVQQTVYYSLTYPDLRQTSGRDHHQHDAAMSFRFDVGPHWLLKLEGHFLRGTAVLDPTLNGNVPRDHLENQWWLLTAKTTVYF